MGKIEKIKTNKLERHHRFSSLINLYFDIRQEENYYLI